MEKTLLITEKHWIFPYYGIIVNKKTRRICDYHNEYGYITFGLKGKNYKAHRYIYETFYNVKLSPKEEINHKNLIKDDNRIDNLEIVSGQKNKQWREKYKNNTSGYKGVSFHKQNKKWEATIRYNNKTIHLGLYDSPEIAYEAYIKKAQELNKINNCMYLF